MPRYCVSERQNQCLACAPVGFKFRKSGGRVEAYILPDADPTILQLWASRHESRAVKSRNEPRFIVKPWFVAQVAPQVAPHERCEAFPSVVSEGEGECG